MICVYCEQLYGGRLVAPTPGMVCDEHRAAIARHEAFGAWQVAEPTG
jgi:hypothetical protein